MQRRDRRGRCPPFAALRTAAIAFALALSAAGASAQLGFTLYGGVRGGGEFQDASDSNKKLSLESGGTLSASIDWGLGDGRQAQVFYSFQRSALPGSAFGQPVEVEVNIGYLHIGGRTFFSGSATTGGGYGVGGLGATFLSPDLSGLSNEVRPSMNLGVGYQWQLSPSVALRAELRGYVTLINRNGQFFCSGGCVVSIRGDAMTQVEGLLGLSIGF